MSRENEINKAAHEYCEKSIPNLQDIPHTIETAFEAGAEYADKHPSRKLMIKVWKIAVGVGNYFATVGDAEKAVNEAKKVLKEYTNKYKTYNK